MASYGTDLHPSQRAVVQQALSWVQNPKRKPFLWIAAVAGMGLTTTMGALSQALTDTLGPHKALRMATTGRAAESIAKRFEIGVWTVHRTLYEFVDGQHRLRPPGSWDGYEVAVVHHADLLDKDVAADLLALGIPVIMAGDKRHVMDENKFLAGRTPDIELTVDVVLRQPDTPPTTQVSVITEQNGQPVLRAETDLPELGIRKGDLFAPVTARRADEAS